jgi:hypothetical protein
MSTAPHSLSKAPHAETEDVAANLELDLIAGSGGSDESNKLDPGYTRNDRRDMHRMGKEQELMVSAGFIMA